MGLADFIYDATKGLPFEVEIDRDNCDYQDLTDPSDAEHGYYSEAAYVDVVRIQGENHAISFLLPQWYTCPQYLRQDILARVNGVRIEELN
jgi:hypothetical protein